MSEDNKHNILFFESPTMKELYDTMESWQNANLKRFLSMSIQQDGENFVVLHLLTQVKW
jgi:hypothetical protein